MGKAYNLVNYVIEQGLKLESIEIQTPPIKLSYTPGELFDPTGMEVLAVYENGISGLVTGYSYSPMTLNTWDTEVTISYAEGPIVKTATVFVTVAKNSIDAPSTSSTLAYNGLEQSPTWSGYDSNAMTISGDLSGINAGNYITTFTLKDSYEWNDGTTDAISITWSIARATIASQPSQSGSLTYNGASKTPSWNNYDSEKLTIGGTTSETNAGTYSATFTPKANYQWSDTSIAAKSSSWSIGKASGTLSLSTTSVTLSESNTSKTISVSSNSAGTITVHSSNTGAATASYSNGTITIAIGSSPGATTITVSLAATTNYSSASSNISVKWDGYTITGDYTSAGTFTHIAKGTSIVAIIIAGGGGGGAGGRTSGTYNDTSSAGGNGGNGGWAGSIVVTPEISVTKGTGYPIVVGEGGSGGSVESSARKGSSSSAFNNTATGGNYGGQGTGGTGGSGVSTSTSSYGSVGSGARVSKHNNGSLVGVPGLDGAQTAHGSSVTYLGVTYQAYGGTIGGGGGAYSTSQGYLGEIGSGSAQTIGLLASGKGVSSSGGGKSGNGGNGSSTATPNKGSDATPATVYGSGGNGGGGAGGCNLSLASSSVSGYGGNGSAGKSGRVIVFEKGV